MFLLRFLFWFFLILYIMRILGRYLFPFLLKRYISKKQQNFHQKFSREDIEEEGKVTINKQSKKKQKKSDDVGEYVDFEEIDE